MWDKREQIYQGTEKHGEGQTSLLGMVVCIIERNMCLEINQADSEKGRVLSQGTEEKR